MKFLCLTNHYNFVSQISFQNLSLTFNSSQDVLTCCDGHYLLSVKDVLSIKIWIDW